MNYTLTIDDVIDIIKKADLDNIQIVERFKNDLFRRNRGISISAAKEFIKTLTVSDLITGPIDDDNPNRKHPVWIFKKRGFECLCYIKLKIINKQRTIIVISLHEGERREA